MKKKWFSVVFGLFLAISACASNDDDSGSGGDGARGDGGLPDARPSADSRPFADARPPGDGGGFPIPDGGFDFGDGGFGGCTDDSSCEEGECCAEIFPGFKVCIDKAEDAGPGECTFTF